MADRFGAREFEASNPKINEIRNWIVKRVENVGGEFAEADEVAFNLDQLISEWERRAEYYLSIDKKFEYWATRRPTKAEPVNAHLMRGAEDPIGDEEVWTAPNSMREVEPSTYFTIWGWAEQMREED
jgi:hypothetical protein